MVFRVIVLLATFAYTSASDIAYAPAAISYQAPAISYQAPAISYQAPAIAAAPASISYQTPALTSQSSNIYRSFGNLGQISTYSKTIDTPFSSVSKSDVRVSNPGLKIATAPAYATPGYAAHAYAAPGPLLGVAYSAAPAVSHINYASGFANYAF